MPLKKRGIETEIQGSIGVNAVGGVFLRQFRWVFREKPKSDWGIDAEVEICDQNRPTGHLLALQIKTGRSYFRRKRGGSIVLYSRNRRHLDYWFDYSLPVFILLHDPDEDVTLWQKVDPVLIRLTKRGWSLEFPISHQLSVDVAKPALLEAARNQLAHHRVGAPAIPGLRTEIEEVAVQANSIIGRHNSTSEGLLNKDEEGGPAGDWDTLDTPSGTTFMTPEDNPNIQLSSIQVPGTNLDLISRLFTDRGKTINMVSGRYHYLYPNTICPDDDFAAQVIFSAARGMARTIKYIEHPKVQLVRGSFVYIGGPMSNRSTSTLLQYRAIKNNDVKEGMERPVFPAMRLPLSFELNPRKLEKIDSKYPVWSLRRATGHGYGELLSPENGKTDLLMITRVPNTAEKKVRGEFRNTILFFSGTHGVGTAAIGLLFRNRKLLEGLDRKMRETEFWQAVFTVNSMRCGKHPFSDRDRWIPLSLSRDFIFEPVAPF
jgi:hypothetical protein